MLCICFVYSQASNFSVGLNGAVFIHFNGGIMQFKKEYILAFLLGMSSLSFVANSFADGYQPGSFDPVLSTSNGVVTTQHHGQLSLADGIKERHILGVVGSAGFAPFKLVFRGDDANAKHVLALSSSSGLGKQFLYSTYATNASGIEYVWFILEQGIVKGRSIRESDLVEAVLLPIAVDQEHILLRFEDAGDLAGAEAEFEQWGLTPPNPNHEIELPTAAFTG